MLPILYEKDEINFATNGLARLTDCVSCSCVEERNGIFEVDFEYPVDGANFSLIQCGRIIGVTHDDSGDIQPFDIVSYSKPISGIVSFHCVHISYRLSGIVCKAKGITGADNAFRALVETAQPDIGNFNLSTESENAISYVAAFDGIPRSVRQMLGGIEGSILDTFGGEYLFDRWDVTLKTSRGVKRDVKIRYGVNLADYNDDTDYLSTYNACIPYWKGNDNGQDTIVYGSVVETGEATAGGRTICAPLDLTDKFENKPTVAQLETMALTVMRSKQTWLPSQTIKVDFVRLQDFEEFTQYKGLYDCNLCDSVDVVFPRYGMSGTYKIVRTVWNVLEGRYSEMEMGALSTSLADALGIGTGKSAGTGSGGAGADYIVEYGTSGNWIYQKWLSGKAECWARIQQQITSWVAWGRLYYGSPFTYYNYPTDLFLEAPVLTVTATMGTGNNGDTLTGASNNGTAIRTPSLYAVRPESGLTGNVYFMVHAIGKWRSVSPSGGGDVTEVADYETLINKPKIEGVTLLGDRSFEDLTLSGMTNSEIEELLNNADS